MKIEILNPLDNTVHLGSYRRIIENKFLESCMFKLGFIPNYEVYKCIYFINEKERELKKKVPIIDLITYKIKVLYEV